MIFETTDKLKRKARKIRQQNEKKWLLLRVLSLLFLVAFTISFVIGIFYIKTTDYKMFDIYAITFSVTFVCFVITRSLLTNLTSHWIQDRLNERIWIENDILYHFMQVAFGTGWNYRNTDSTAYVFEMDISTIRNAKFDEKSHRIEFTINGRGCHYSDYRRKIIDREWELNGFQAIFYDATNPSLYEYLKGIGIPFEVGTIEYKMTNKI